MPGEALPGPALRQHTQGDPRWPRSPTGTSARTSPSPTSRTAARASTTPGTPRWRTPRSSPCGPRRGRPTCWWCCWTTSASGPPAPSGGRCRMPTAERLAAGGLKFTRFHTTALCSPTRQALLTGRNHHAVGMGGITEIATAAPGYSSIRPDTCAPLAADAEAERLRHGPVRQVPRGAGVGDQPHGPLRRLAHRGRGLRVLLRLHRRARPTSTTRPSTRAPPRWSRTRRRRRATTSWRT